MGQLKTMDIKGKAYVTVAERLKHFRTAEEFKGWSIESEWIKINEDIAICKAIAKNEAGVIKSTGTAMEKRAEIKPDKKMDVNVTSHIENCETSAIGRALGNLGIGIDGGNVASFDEIQRAAKKNLIMSITSMLDEENREEYEKQYKLNELPLMQIEELEIIEKQLLVNEKKKVCKAIINISTPDEVKSILRKYKTNLLETIDLKELIFIHDMKVKQNGKISKKEIDDLKECAEFMDFDLEDYVSKHYKKKIEELTKKEYSEIKEKMTK